MSQSITRLLHCSHPTILCWRWKLIWVLVKNSLNSGKIGWVFFCTIKQQEKNSCKIEVESLCIKIWIFVCQLPEGDFFKFMVAKQCLGMNYVLQNWTLQKYVGKESSRWAHPPTTSKPLNFHKNIAAIFIANCILAFNFVYFFGALKIQHRKKSA